MAPPRTRAPSRPHAASDPPQRLPNEPPCNVQAEAIDRQTKAIEEQTAAINRAVADLRTAFKPAADAIHSLGDAQVKLCNFIVNNRLKLVGGMIAALVTVGAISPNAASVLGAILKSWGLS